MSFCPIQKMSDQKTESPEMKTESEWAKKRLLEADKVHNLERGGKGRMEKIRETLERYKLREEYQKDGMLQIGLSEF